MEPELNEIYKGREVHLVDWVELPIPTKPGHVHFLIIGREQQVVIHLKDMWHKSSWKHMINYIINNGSEEKQGDLKLIYPLQKFEKKYRVNLGKILRKCVPLAY